MNWLQIIAGFLLGAFFGPWAMAKVGAKKAPSY